jgi:predicted AlkP superfamily pyrophosphatase or phosphodiesterase
VTIDGARPDAIAQTRSPNIKEIQSRGSATMQANSVFPSVTLPCHTSIFHSVPPDRHGILMNTWQPMAKPVPGLIEIAHQHNKHSAFFYNWENLRDLNRPGNLEHSYFLNSAEVYPPDSHGDHLIAEAANNYISTSFPDFAFVYFGTLDVFGHAFGWMSDKYLEQLGLVDEALGLLLDHLPKDSTILVLSDHGGHERNHGTDSFEDMTIPWIISGPGIRAGHAIMSPVSLMDTAPTLAQIMGLDAPKEWEGECVEEIFLDR